MIFMGIVPESPTDQLYVGFTCTGIFLSQGHEKAYPLIPMYREWYDHLVEIYTEVRHKYNALPPQMSGSFKIDLDRVMAQAVSLIIDRSQAGPDETGTEGLEGVTGPTGPNDIIEGAYTIFTDGSCHPNPGPGGWGIVVINPDGAEIDRRSVPRNEDVTNNEAEYGGIIEALMWAKINGVDVLTVLSDSEVCINQLNGVYEARKPELAVLRDKALALAKQFKSVSFDWVSGEVNPAHEPAEQGYRKSRELRGLPAVPESKSKKRKRKKR
jgi:ribonuclease HI